MAFGNAKRKEPRSLPYQAPAGRKSGAECGADKHIVIQIPDRRLTRRGIVKEIVWLPVAVKVGRSYQGPATGRSRPKSSANENVVVQIPDRCLSSSGVEQGIIWMAVAVEIRHTT